MIAQTVKSLNLRRPVFKKTAAYGHFAAPATRSPGRRPTRPPLKAGAKAELVAK
jgi:S-adenosylmethionine synthetase